MEQEKNFWNLLICLGQFKMFHESSKVLAILIRPGPPKDKLLGKTKLLDEYSGYLLNGPRIECVVRASATSLRAAARVMYRSPRFNVVVVRRRAVRTLADADEGGADLIQCLL